MAVSSVDLVLEETVGTYDPWSANDDAGQGCAFRDE